MNLDIHHVINAITGLASLAIIDAILAGERNPGKRAQYREQRIK